MMLAGSYLISTKQAKAEPKWKINEIVQTNQPSYDFKNTITIINRAWQTPNPTTNDNIKEVRFPAGSKQGVTSNTFGDISSWACKINNNMVQYMPTNEFNINDELKSGESTIMKVYANNPSSNYFALSTTNLNFLGRTADGWTLTNDITAPSWILTNKNTDVSLNQNYTLTPTNFTSNINITNNTPIAIDKISILNAEDIQSLTNNQGWINFLGNTSSLSNGYLGLNDSIKISYESNPENNFITTQNCDIILHTPYNLNITNSIIGPIFGPEITNAWEVYENILSNSTLFQNQITITNKGNTDLNKLYFKTLFGANGGATVSNITEETGKIQNWTNSFNLEGIIYQSTNNQNNIKPGEGETIEFRSELSNGNYFVGKSAELIGNDGALTQEISTVRAIPEPGIFFLLSVLSVPCTFFKLRGKAKRQEYQENQENQEQLAEAA